MSAQSQAAAHGRALAENDFAGWRVIKAPALVPRLEAAHELPQEVRGPPRWQFTIIRDADKLISHVLAEPLQEVTL